MFNKLPIEASPLELIKDDNGTSLASYVRTLMEKADAKDVPVIVLAMVPDGEDPKLALASNVDMHNIPDILSQLGSLMRKNKPVAGGFVSTPPTQIN